MKKISIIVPVYQAEKYILKCIESIVNQTYNNLEIILIDDGSTDHSGEICDRCGESDKRIVVVHNKNKGVSAARNCGLGIATGDYITFVDSDDFLEPQMYSEMMQVAEKHSCDVVMCDCIKEYKDKSERYTHAIREGFYDKEQLKQEYYLQLLITPNIEYPATISNCLCLIKKEIGKKICYIEGVRHSEDLLLGAQMMYMANSFYYMKGQYFYHYNCCNVNSATHTFHKDKWDDYKQLYDKAYDYFKKSKEYNFEEQLNLLLLFFVYNAVGDILETRIINRKDKRKIINNILSDHIVRRMFHEIKIDKLKISKKLKIQTYLYKYQKGVRMLIIWHQRKNENKNISNCSGL